LQGINDVVGGRVGCRHKQRQTEALTGTVVDDDQDRRPVTHRWQVRQLLTQAPPLPTVIFDFMALLGAAALVAHGAPMVIQRPPLRAG